MKRGRPGNPGVRKGSAVGPDYAESRFRNPFDGPELDEQYGTEGEKTIVSPSDTVSGKGVPLHHSYDEYWEGK
jgi:hypothetical protein